MRWLQGTFAVRFNGLRQERGHLFQGRYKSLVVDPDEGLGPLCHYIHLNPVRARLTEVDGLSTRRWTSLHGLMEPKRRPAWHDPQPALAHAGGLADTPAGRRKYLEYLAWLSEDESARKEQRFAEMAKGWVIGAKEFAQALAQENRELTGQGKRLAAEGREAVESIWQEELVGLLHKLRRMPEELAATGKSVDWKLAVAAALKARTTVTNRWLAATMHLGNLYEVSRKVSAWSRQPDSGLLKKLRTPPSPKA
jgi:hypothetical protein